MTQQQKADLPKSWLQVTLSDLFLDPKNNIVGGPFGSNLKSSEYTSEGVPVFRIQNIDRNKFIDKNINYVTEEKAEFLSRHSFESGDIIITKLGDPLGKTCFVPKKYKRGIIVADLIRVRVDNKNVNPKFLVYQLNSPFFIKQFDWFTKGTTRPRIKLSVVRDLAFNLPPLVEQERIVSVIEELFSDLDNGLQYLKAAQNQLKVYRQALLKYAFEGKLTKQWRNQNKVEPAGKLLKTIKLERQNRFEKELDEWKQSTKAWEKIGKKGKRPRKPKSLFETKRLSDSELERLPNLPKGWLWLKNKSIALKITDGEHATPRRTDSGYYLLSARNIQNGYINFSDVDYVGKEEYERIRRRCNPEFGDILISCSGSIGRISHVPKEADFVMVRSVALVKYPNNVLNFKFLEFLYQSPDLQRQIARGSKATAQANLFLGPIGELNMILCSIEEQELIVNELESKFSIIDYLEKVIGIGILKSEALRQSILKKAFEGELVDQDSKDESASELLKNIQEERDKYLDKQKVQKKKAPKKTKKMSKELNITDVLKSSKKPMLTKDVWQQSMYKDDIEEFYAELKIIQDDIKEVKKGTESLLSFRK